VPPLDARDLRRSGRARRGSIQGPIEALERREVLSYSALGYSLPDVSVTGFGPPIAAWGQPIAVSVAVYNQGSSSINEPLNLAQGAASTADAPPSTVTVFATTRPGGHNGVRLGSIDVPSIHQNDVVTGSGTFTLPPRPRGLPGNGGHLYLTFIENAGRTFNEANYQNNTFVSNQPVTIAPALPNLKLVGFQVPGSLQPGDTLDPAIRIANLGAADTGLQGPLVVQIVASENTTYGPGDAVLATYTVPNIPSLATAPSTTGSLGDLNLQPSNNIVTLSGQIITLPSTPKTYYLGVKINPLNTIHQVGQHLTPNFDALVKVGPAIPAVPPSTIIGGGSGPLPQFPFPFGAANAVVTPSDGTLATTSVRSIQTAAIEASNQLDVKAVAVASKPIAPSAPILRNATPSGPTLLAQKAASYETPARPLPSFLRG